MKGSRLTSCFSEHISLLLWMLFSFVSGRDSYERASDYGLAEMLCLDQLSKVATGCKQRWRIEVHERESRRV